MQTAVNCASSGGTWSAGSSCTGYTCPEF
jgi:hypothetical protein